MFHQRRINIFIQYTELRFTSQGGEGGGANVKGDNISRTTGYFQGRGTFSAVFVAAEQGTPKHDVSQITLSGFGAKS